MAEIGFIGMGNMGYAILKGMLKWCPKENITFYDADGERSRLVEEKNRSQSSGR